MCVASDSKFQQPPFLPPYRFASLPAGGAPFRNVFRARLHRPKTNSSCSVHNCDFFCFGEMSTHFITYSVQELIGFLYRTWWPRPHNGGPPLLPLPLFFFFFFCLLLLLLLLLAHLLRSPLPDARVAYVSRTPSPRRRRRRSLFFFLTRVGGEEEDAGVVAVVAFRGVAAVLLDGGGVAAAAAPEGGLAPLVVLSLSSLSKNGIKWFRGRRIDIQNLKRSRANNNLFNHEGRLKPQLPSSSLF